MSNKLTHDEVMELLPLFVLGALEPEEMMAVDDYIQVHPEWLPRLQALEETAAQLAYAAPHMHLPAAAKDKLMQRVSGAAPKATPVPLVAQPPSVWQTFLHWLQNGNRWAGATAVAFSLLLFVSLYTLQLRANVADLRQTNEQLQTENETLQEVNIRLQEEIIRDDTVFAQFSTAERVIALPGTEEAPQATGVFLVDGLDGLFVLRNLAALPADQAYQLWLVPPGGGPPDAVSVGLLEDLSSTGAAQQAVTIPIDLQDFAIVDVSVEPAGGSEHLSGPVIIRARVEQ